jgi:bacterial/archaeal transporter family protein
MGLDYYCPPDRRLLHTIGNMEQYRWLIYALLGAVAAAIISPLGKVGVKGLDSNVVTAVRSVFQALVVVLVVTALGLWGNLKQFSGKSFAMAALAGLAGGVSWLCMFKALASPGGDVSKVGPIDKLSMPLSILLAVLFLRESPSWVNWAGIGMMVVGAYLVAHKG